MDKKKEITNKVEIFETISLDKAGAIERAVFINEKLVYQEITTALLDRNSTSNLKLFVDWLLGIETKIPGSTGIKKITLFQRLRQILKW